MSQDFLTNFYLGASPMKHTTNSSKFACQNFVYAPFVKFSLSKICTILYYILLYTIHCHTPTLIDWYTKHIVIQYKRQKLSNNAWFREILVFMHAHFCEPDPTYDERLGWVLTRFWHHYRRPFSIHCCMDLYKRTHYLSISNNL